jgi:chemotaxis protein histidine kinase CheA
VAPQSPPNALDDASGRFLKAANTQLRKLEHALINLSADRDVSEFRAMHEAVSSIENSALSNGCKEISALASAAERLLAAMGASARRPPGHAVDTLKRSTDAFRLLAERQAGSLEIKSEIDELVAELNRCRSAFPLAA